MPVAGSVPRLTTVAEREAARLASGGSPLNGVRHPVAEEPKKRSGCPKYAPPRTPEFIAAAKLRWEAGLSASKIGSQMGVSRDVIIGIAHRHGFSARPSPIVRR